MQKRKQRKLKKMSEDFEVKGDKIFYKKRQCPFCKSNLRIVGLDTDSVMLNCEKHPNFTLYITEDLSKLFKGKCEENGK